MPQVGSRADSASYEKFVIDFDQLGAMHVLAEGIDLSDNGQAMEAFHQSSRAAIFSAAAHPGEFRDRLLSLQVADNNSVEQWRVEGSKDGPPAPTPSGNRCWPICSAAFEPAKDEAIREFIDKRKASMPDANY